MTYDIGDVIPLSVTVKNSSGTPQNATSASYTITKPNGSTTSSGVLTGVSGVYDWDFTGADLEGLYGVRFVATGTNAIVVPDSFTVRSSTLAMIVSLADLKAELNITSTTSDEELRTYLDRATSIIESTIGRSIRRQTVTETLSVGSGEKYLLLTPPILSVTSVVDNGYTVASTAYQVDGARGTIYRDQGFIGGPSQVVVTYVAGYAAPPAALQHAVLMQVAHMWETQRTTPGARRSDDWNPAQGYMVPNRVLEALRPFMMPGSAA